MADLASLLLRTSRTFALAIPELPAPTRTEVTVAYLLFRIADTFEDATLWSPDERTAALLDFAGSLSPSANGRIHELARAWRDTPPLRHDGYTDLLAETPAVVDTLSSLAPEAQRVIRAHVLRTAEGMARYAGQSGDLRLQSVEELRDYCHVVAGIVGEMLTELYALGRAEVARISPYLGTRARFFGEGLQLVNILKDASGDAREGRWYVPASVPRSEVFALARDDLVLADEYVRALDASRTDRGLVAFNALPVLLARATLDRVEASGAGSKLTRPEVVGIHRAMHDALDQGEPVMDALKATRTPGSAG